MTAGSLRPPGTQTPAWPGRGGCGPLSPGLWPGIQRLVHMAKPGQAGPPRPRRVPGGSQGTQRPSGPPCHPPQGQGLWGATPTYPPPSTASLTCFCIKSANGGRQRRHGLGKERASALPRLGSIGGAASGGVRGEQNGETPGFTQFQREVQQGGSPTPHQRPCLSFPIHRSRGLGPVARLAGRGFRGLSHGAPGPETRLRLSEGTAGAAKPGSPPGLSDWRCRTVGSLGSERQAMPMWPPVGVHRACALRVYPLHLASWGRVASDPEGPPGPSRGSEGTPSPGAALGKPLTTLLGTTFQSGALCPGALVEPGFSPPCCRETLLPAPSPRGAGTPPPAEHPPHPTAMAGQLCPAPTEVTLRTPSPGAWQG